MRQSYALDTRQQQNQRIDPRQILASEILTWTAPELEAAIERELSENPALEVRENETLPAALESTGFGAAQSGGPGAAAPTVLSLVPGAAAPPGEADRFDRASLSGATTSSAGSGSTSASGGVDNADDPMERVAASLTLHDHLRAQVGQVARGSREAFLVRDLIECVDDRGYLSADLNEIAADRAACLADAEAAVNALQAMDPPGVGARDLHECLLLQATYLDQVGEGDPLAVPLLSRCWDELVARREAKIAQRLGAPLADVQRALEFVQQTLTPYPGSAFRPEWGGGRSGRSGGGAPAVRPDIVFCRTEAGFAIEVPGDYAPHVMLAPLWQKLAEKPESCKDDGMRRYVREHVERAEGFLHGLQRRGRTLRAIAQALAELQQGYLETGNRAFLRPLTRATLSERLALDESVISRAVADKFARLPSGDVLPLDAFFGNAHAVRDALAQLIEGENPASPYSDDEIADILTSQGFPLARRTVAKYRGLEKILPARLRKRA